MTTSLTIAIGNNSSYNILEDSFSLPDRIEENSTCSFTIDDANGTLSFKKGQRVTVDDTLEGRLFTGEIQGIKRYRGPDDVGSRIYHELSCVDKTKVLDQKTSNKQYSNQYAGAIAIDQIKDEWVNGITANYAIDVDDTQADFVEGGHSGTQASSTLEDGNLELALAGAKTTINENSTSIFNAGTLTGVTASSNTLAPTTLKAIKMQCVQTGLAISNSYTYVKIWQPSGTFTVVATRYLFYKIWIDPSSPEAKFSVDIVFTDNTTLRDNFNVNTGKELSQNRLSPHPGTDLDGYANRGKWYGRTFSLGWAAGKNISYITVACEGDNPGTYTAYIREIMYLNADFSLNQYFFSTTLNVNPPQQMHKAGFASTSVKVVDVYDCESASRVSPAYNIDQVKLNKSSFISWKETKPENTDIIIKYSLDNGNSYTRCVNNTALPNFPAGLSLSGKTIKFLQEFQQREGVSPEVKPVLNSLQLVISPSYTATKSDVTYSATTTSEINSGATHTNTRAANNLLQLIQITRDFNNNTTDNEMSGITLYGGGASGPNTDTTCMQWVEARLFREFVFQNKEARSRLDFVGSSTYQDFIFEYDVYIDNINAGVGCTYRTTNWSNYNNRHAYTVEVRGTTLTLGRGTNSGDGSDGSFTSIATATVPFTSQTWHRYKLEISGSNHKIYLDDILYINATDSTFSAAGYVGLRIINFSSTDGYIGAFDNIGIAKTLTGNWKSPSNSLAAAGTYLNSVVSWEDASTDPDAATILVESTINAESSWQTVTNGGSIPNLTAGQSLSGISVKFRVTLTTPTATAMPQIKYFVARILGGFSSSGTRTSKALLLDSVGTCGTTLVFWNEVKPANTSIAVATSLDGTNYTNVSNGGSIAGLLQQPAPSIDSFNLLSAASYTNTARTGGTATAGWIWDAASSRLSVSGGTNALLLYSSISTKDIDIIFDIDQADQAGVVWRRTDNSNFYELDVFDASSSAGATNVMRLYKVVSNTKTQIGTDITIKLVRGQIVKRVRVSMIGTAISIYFDGSLVRSTTDSSLSSAGLAGFIEVSGVARFYNLRIQPIGDDLTNKKVYTKITLTSTDPTATPQITDFITLVTNPDIQIGKLIPTADYRNTYKSDNINDVAKQSDYIWNIKPSGKFIFKERKTEPAPWVLVSPSTSNNNDILAGMSVEDLADLYRNRHTLKGVRDQKSVNETKIGDGTATSWTLQYNVVSVSSMALNGQSVTFGKKGIDSGKDFYYEIGSNSLAQDSNGTVLQKEVDALSISYVGEFETDVVRDNTGQFPGTISQKDYIAQCGLSIPVVSILAQASAVQSTSSASDDLDVGLCRRIAVDINVTARSGTPTIQFFVERKSADGSYTILYSSSVINTSTAQVARSIGPRCTTKESLGSTVRLRWTLSGSGSFTFSASILGKVDAGLAGIGVVEAVEDVSDQNLTVAAAEALGDSRLQKYGVIGHVLHFETRRTGLAAGQYLNCFVPELGFNDAALLITSVDRKQSTIVDSDGVSQTQDYVFTVSATDAATLTSWSKAMNDASIV